MANETTKTEAEKIERVFNFNGVSLPDPDPAMSPDQVRNHYAPHYPQLTNALTKGPVTENGKATYSFTQKTGTKG